MSSGGCSIRVTVLTSLGLLPCRSVASRGVPQLRLWPSSPFATHLLVHDLSLLATFHLTRHDSHNPSLTLVHHVRVLRQSRPGPLFFALCCALRPPVHLYSSLVPVLCVSRPFVFLVLVTQALVLSCEAAKLQEPFAEQICPSPCAPPSLLHPLLICLNSVQLHL